MRSGFESPYEEERLNKEVEETLREIPWMQKTTENVPSDIIKEDIKRNLAQEIAAEENISIEEALETAEKEVEFPDQAPFNINMFDELYRSNKKAIPEIIPEIIPEGEGKEISNVDEIFENSEIFNKNFALSTAYGEVLPESYAPGTTAYSLFQQLKAGFTNMSDDEILQKMIDNDMIKERL